MPLGPGVRYRWKRMPNGRMVRLAFKNNKVVEVKPKGGKAKLLKSAKAILSGE